MNRQRALKVLLIVVGLLFCAAFYPMLMFLKQEPALAMMLSLYGTLGVFLLLAARNPSAHCSLIAFTAWSSFAHAAVMTVQAYQIPDERVHFLGGSAALAIIGIALIALAPAKPPAQLSTARTAHATTL